MLMKLMWFHLMPYTELPDNFREANPSVWVDIHSSLFDPKRAHLMYNDFMDELEYAAQCGFDAVCVNEHHSNGYGLMPSPNLIASSLARRTSDTAICVMGNSLALYNPPTRVAEEFAMIDCISGGRLIAGFPVGTPMDTCYVYGTNPSQLRQRYHEAHDLVLRAWTEQDTFAFNGRFNQQRYVNIWPRPVQRPHPPIWIPGGGSVETWRWCAEMDYVYCYLSYYGYKAGRATMDGFWAEMKRLGKAPNPYHAGFLQFVGVGESRQHAFDLYSEAAEYFYGRCLHVDARWATPPGYTSEDSQRAGIESQIKQAADANVRGKSTGERFASVAREMDAIVDKGYVIIGSANDVAEQLREVAVNLNVGHLMLLLQFGNMSKELCRYNTQSFARDVIPKLKGLFSEWDDRWWPRPMAAAQRADVPAFLPKLAAE
jgi:alkanesulfonate monooxygenase SsuD/methylene tetrahydromethanopterin reductase-like flavin-dependent oxidoreductase (luciferase family)